MKHSALKNHFGHNSFRELQEEGIDALLNARDLLMILPTGGGKSLVYQLPTMLKEGISIVISPLIALMQDQVAALLAQNISAAMISSAQSREEIDSNIQRAYDKELKFLYLSPERLNNSATIGMLQGLDINFFVIDEAHCISQWGHEFREDYRALGNLKANFPTTPVCAFTATSTEHVTSDILRELRLENPLLLKGKLFRKNIFISVQRRISNGYEQLKTLLLRHKNESGIVYVSSRKKAEELSVYLNKSGYNSLPYHAGLEQHVREQNFKIFVNDKVDIIVATVAFGMGIDKSDIRFVVHMSLPKSLENYYQEIGRAGRDGEDAEALLLFNTADIVQHKRFVEEIQNRAYKEHLAQKMQSMYKYAAGEICFHQQIARYFDDTLERCKERCDNCLQSDAQRQNITKEAQMLLSAVYKTKQSFGKNYIIDILRGSKEQKILLNGADKLSVYGIGAHLKKKEWFIVLERLFELRIIISGEFHTLKLTQKAADILRAKEEIFIRSSRLYGNEREKKIKREETIDYDKEIFEKLRLKRSQIAEKLEIPAYIIFSDGVLKNLAALRPDDKESMLKVSGVGQKKFAQFGKAFLEVLNP